MSCLCADDTNLPGTLKNDQSSGGAIVTPICDQNKSAITPILTMQYYFADDKTSPTLFIQLIQQKN